MWATRDDGDVAAGTADAAADTTGATTGVAGGAAKVKRY
jgi:hypothetical protein